MVSVFLCLSGSEVSECLGFRFKGYDELGSDIDLNDIAKEYHLQVESIVDHQKFVLCVCLFVELFVFCFGGVFLTILCIFVVVVVVVLTLVENSAHYFEADCYILSILNF